MSRFEYLSVLVSIVIALGITEVTISWSRVLQRRDRARFYWLHSFWTIFSLFLMIQFWWGFWNFRLVDPWSLFSLMGVLVEAITLVLAALVLAPRGDDASPLDLEALYFANCQLFFSLGAALILQLSLIDTLVAGKPFATLENLFRLPGIAVALIAAYSKSVRVHGVVVILALVLLAGFLENAINV